MDRAGSGGACPEAGPTYGPLSAVAAFLLWLWIAMLIVLCCAELDSEIERGTSLYGGHAGPDRT